MAPRKPDSCPGPLSDQGRGSSVGVLSQRAAGSGGWIPGGQSPAPLAAAPSPGQPQLPGVKSVWPGQAREQLSTPPALPQDSWAGGEALARERHLPVSGEKEDTREGLRDRGRPLGAGRPLSVNQEGLPPPVGALARPSWWEGLRNGRAHIHLDAGGHWAQGEACSPDPRPRYLREGSHCVPRPEGGVGPSPAAVPAHPGKGMAENGHGLLGSDRPRNTGGPLGTPLWGRPQTHPLGV